MEAGRRAFLRLVTGGSVVSLLAACSGIEVSAAQSASSDLNLPEGAFGRNVEVIGYTNLDGRPGFKLDIQQLGDRWYLYMGHLWHRGWTIAEVTDPSNPNVVNFIPGPT